MRKLILAVVCLIAAAVVVDFGSAAYTEYRVSRGLREGAGLDSDPSVTITGFPFLVQAANGRYRHVEIRSTTVPSAELGDVAVEADLHGVLVPASDLLGGRVQSVRVEHLDGRVKIEATNLGAYLGIPDLEVSAPPADRSDGTGGSGGSGMSTGGGIVLTGTVPVGPVSATVSVTADLVLDGDNVTIVATDLYFGPEGHADFTVPATLKPAVLGLFTRQIDVRELPFGVRPTKVYAQGSQVAIEGSGDDVVINLEEMVAS